MQTQISDDAASQPKTVTPITRIEYVVIEPPKQITPPRAVQGLMRDVVKVDSSR